MREFVLPQARDLVSLHRGYVPPALCSGDRVFRTGLDNTVDADDDVAVIQVWLNPFRRALPHAPTARRSCAATTCGVPVGTLHALAVDPRPDCQAYRRLLPAVPADWVRGARTGPHRPRLAAVSEAAEPV